MRKLVVFETVSLDGYFAGLNGDLSWAHTNDDDEWSDFVSNNASGDDGPLLFGRITYEMMVSFWPTPQATQSMPKVAEGMNSRPKVVFSKTLENSPWNNTKIARDAVDAVRQMKDESGENLVVLGSGQIVSQLASAGLIDELQLVVAPVILGDGKKLFNGVNQKDLTLTKTRTFKNGNILICYEPKA
ncbi:MAG: dihydrofolate reductase family protein [Gemmatimonadales bacterium]